MNKDQLAALTDRIYVDSIKVSAGQFTIETGKTGKASIRRNIRGHIYVWGMQLEQLTLLHRAIGEYLHMRSKEDV